MENLAYFTACAVSQVVACLLFRQQGGLGPVNDDGAAAYLLTALC